MVGKTVPLSVRVSQEDAEYISSLDIVGAVTPSEKLRAIIGNARLRNEGFQDYEGCLRNLGELSNPLLVRIQSAEHAEDIHSEVVQKVVSWCHETMAFALAAAPADTEADDLESTLKALEQGVTERIMKLVLEVLRMGITEESNCYDPKAISSRLDKALELAQVIQSSRTFRQKQ